MNLKIPDILKKIVEHKKGELDAYPLSIDEWTKRAADAAPPLDFKHALAKPGLSIIAEIKKASPSAGIISEDFNPKTIAQAYKDGGADAVSVLTDIEFFKGSPEYIVDVREILSGIPIIRKDFIIEPIQIFEARALGADSFLLIASILSEEELSDFLLIGRSLGMEALVESHTIGELEKSISAGGEILGVNNRNLHNFNVDLAVAEELIDVFPKGSIAVGESGIKDVADAKRLAMVGYDALLVGESLMRSGINGCGETIENFKEVNL